MLALNAKQGRRTYDCRVIMADPVITADRKGTVSIEAPTGAQVFYAVGDKNSARDFTRYTKPFDLSKGGRVSAYVLDPATDNKSDFVVAEFGVSKAKWKITDCSFANERSASVQRLIDGDLNTMWHTHGKEGRIAPPHWVAIDMGETVEIAGFSYMPRHDGSFVGLIDRYTIYVSDDGIDWGSPMAKGEFSNIRNNPVQRSVLFEKPVQARFVKFVADHAVGNNDCVAICELGIFSE